MHIPKEIDDDEILVRFIFIDHFKKKNQLEEINKEYLNNFK